MIRFGSRTDCLVPRGTEIRVRPGERVKGGVTVLGTAGMIRRGRARGPRRRRWQELREKRRRGMFLLPSLLTTGNLFCGFLALLLAANHRFVEAALAIFVAMVMDLLDGRVARLMKATSQFGVEFDSLADVVSFCVAPAFLLYAFALKDLGRPAWFGAFLFVICGALRLARFNVQTASVDRRFFVGLSTPAAAGIVASGVLLLSERAAGAPRVKAALAAGTYLVALLMVSTFRYWSFKEVDFARRHPAADAAGAGAGHDDRGRQSRAVPVPALRGLCACRARCAGWSCGGSGARRGAGTQRGVLDGGWGTMNRVIIFDTTLRDGEQAPGFSMNTMEKLEMARQLARLNVDVIEAGFPISSEDDFEATREVARQVGTLEGAPIIAGSAGWGWPTSTAAGRP